MNTHSIDLTGAVSFDEPPCQKCGCRTRLVGIEPHPTRPGTDLRTYQCLACNDMQAMPVTLAS